MILIPLAGCGRQDSPSTQDPAEKETPFIAAFRHNCSGCHGADGRLGPAPLLNDPMFVAWMPREVFVRTVRDGIPGTPMPAFLKVHGGSLSGDEIEELVDGARQQWGKPQKEFASLPPYKLPLATHPSHERVEAGGRLFARICALCHGPEGRGATAGALHNRAFLDLMSNQVLHRVAITGRPDLGMPDYRELGSIGGLGHPLTADEIDDLVAYVISWRVPEPVP